MTSSAKANKLWCTHVYLWYKVAKEYAEQLGINACINMFDEFKSYEGLFLFLNFYVNSRFMFRLFHSRTISPLMKLAWRF